jgi:hypothetical protein
MVIFSCCAAIEVDPMPVGTELDIEPPTGNPRCLWCR